MITAAFQEARHFTPATKTRYRELAERTGFVCALGEGLPEEPLPAYEAPPCATTTPCAASGT